MNILVSGSHGLIGSAAIPFFRSQGYRVVRLVRSASASGADEIGWDPAAGVLDRAGLEGLDGVVHLAGESLAGGKWTPEKKARIRQSRIQGSRLLCEALADLAQPPQTLICASAVGYYGSRGEEWVDESSPAGQGFLAEVCREWEAATAPAVQRGIRVINLRFGMVLSAAGGSLAMMLPAFRKGMGAVLGRGQQWMSWITLDDVVGVLHHALLTTSLRGPVNAVTPHPVTNREFTHTLGKVLGRPTFLTLPAFAVRLIFGEMAEELLLASTRVAPARLRETGYPYRFPRLEEALQHLLSPAKG
jgi:uncharacterized protein (TIGR01777 family)